QGVRYPEVELTLRNTSVEAIPISLFTNLEYVRNVSLDLRNNTIKSVANPSSVGAPNIPRKTFLSSIFMSDNPWNCDCQLGWVETWQRKMRQFNRPGDVDPLEDTRMSLCKNKQNKPLLTVLKSDLECGWSSAPVTVSPPHLFVMIFFALLPQLLVFMNNVRDSTMLL
ncbi:hypothetical protein AAG570_000852, partial [Ranatra chinensis]